MQPKRSFLYVVALLVFIFSVVHIAEAEVGVGVNFDLTVPLTIGGKQPEEEKVDCDRNKYNCAPTVPNEATSQEIIEGIKKYGPTTKIYAHGTRIWYVLGPFTRGG